MRLKALLAVIIIANTCFSVMAQKPATGNAKPNEGFSEDDWNKLSQHQKDSINKIIFEKYQREQAGAQKAEEQSANQTLEKAFANIGGATTIAFRNYPKATFDKDLSKLSNLEEFTCERCKALDLDKLFDQLGKLPKLKKLNLQGGEYKVLPASIKKLGKIEAINFKDNNFVTLPDSFSLLKNLKVLNLEHNAYLYDDDVYDRIKNLNVEDLNFSASGLAELNLKIGNVKSLKRLDVSINDIKILPPTFNQLSSLEKLSLNKNLNLDMNQVTSMLVQLPGLTELYLQECTIDNLPLDFGKLTHLKTLDLKANRLTALPLTFGSLTGLEYLDLGYFEMGTRMNKISDLGPSFGQLKNLKYLNLAGNQLQTLPEGFSGLTEMQELNLSLNKLPGFPQSVTQLKKLKTLDLSLNEASSIATGIGGLTELEVLHLDGNFFNRADKKIKALPDEMCSLKNLRILTLKDNVLEQLPDCISNLSKLEKLDLRDNVLTYLPQTFSQLKNLKWLDLKANDLSILPGNFAGLSGLKELNLAMNTKINYVSTKEKLIKMPQLEVVDLSFNNIPKEELASLVAAMPNCKVIQQDYRNSPLPRNNH